MDRIETVSTSAKTADCTPIVVRDGDRTRLVFRPTIVENENQPRACINGDFVYQRKRKNEAWEPLNQLALSNVKAGEQYRLELHSAELFKLVVEGLGPLYRLAWQERGLQYGKKTYVRMEAGAAAFLEQSQADLESFLNENTPVAVTVLLKLMKWFTSRTTPAAAEQLAEMEPDQLPAVSALLGLATLKAAVAQWEANRENGSEPFWHDALARQSFVLSQLFARPVVMMNGRAYLGGKSLDDSGGSYADFLASSALTGAVAIIEIKTPQTALLGNEYRTGAFGASKDLAGAIAQVLKYRKTLATSFAALQLESDQQRVLGNLPCYVVVGDFSELDTLAKRESFEAFRQELRNVHVVTYDELFKRVHDATAILEGLSISQET